MAFAGTIPAAQSAPSYSPDRRNSTRRNFLDGEIVALDEEGRPSFNALQNYGSSTAPLFYYVFDIIVFRGRDVMNEPLERRRELLESAVSKVADPVRLSPVFNASLADLIASVKARGLAGFVAAVLSFGDDQIGKAGSELR